jgi:hypothetical protein
VHGACCPVVVFSCNQHPLLLSSAGSVRIRHAGRCQLLTVIRWGYIRMLHGFFSSCLQHDALPLLPRVAFASDMRGLTTSHNGPLAHSAVAQLGRKQVSQTGFWVQYGK